MKLRKVNCLKRFNCVTKTRDLLSLLLLLVVVVMLLLLLMIIIMCLFFTSPTAAVTGLGLINALFMLNDAPHSL
jgi:hypothetical protein